MEEPGHTKIEDLFRNIRRKQMDPKNSPGDSFSEILAFVRSSRSPLYEDYSVMLKTEAEPLITLKGDRSNVADVVQAGGDFLKMRHEKFLKDSTVHQLSVDDGNGKHVRDIALRACRSTRPRRITETVNFMKRLPTLASDLHAEGS
jgi:hypothetical protein